MLRCSAALTQHFDTASDFLRCGGLVAQIYLLSTSQDRLYCNTPLGGIGTILRLKLVAVCGFGSGWAYVCRINLIIEGFG